MGASTSRNSAPRSLRDNLAKVVPASANALISLNWQRGQGPVARAPRARDRRELGRAGELSASVSSALTSESPLSGLIAAVRASEFITVSICSAVAELLSWSAEKASRSTSFTFSSCSRPACASCAASTAGSAVRDTDAAPRSEAARTNLVAVPHTSDGREGDALSGGEQRVDRVDEHVEAGRVGLHGHGLLVDSIVARVHLISPQPMFRCSDRVSAFGRGMTRKKITGEATKSCTERTQRIYVAEYLHEKPALKKAGCCMLLATRHHDAICPGAEK